MKPLTAFIARSFSPEDEQRIRPILEFLDTFREVGFLCESADRAEVESVSQKVRKAIDEKQVFIGFFTRRYPIINRPAGVRGALQSLFGNGGAQMWTPPAWVLQESGYALRAQKDLILLREDGVEIPGLQGDLEYVPFDANRPATVQHKLNEMIHKLLAKAAGTEVSVTISEREETEEVAAEPPPATPDGKTSNQEPDDRNIIKYWFDMQTATTNRDFVAIYNAWKAGAELIANGEDWIDQLSWDCVYNESRFEAGAADGLETLRRLCDENPQRPQPLKAVARRLEKSGEHDEAAALFLNASALEQGQHKAATLILAADAFRESKNYEAGNRAIELAISLADSERREEAIRLKYQILRDSGNYHLAFAFAESALHENPNLNLRFMLGLDYHRRDLTELALLHFRFLHERNSGDSSSLHNLALMCNDSKLPITSVQLYKQSVLKGETLSAANLGYLYLDCGMVDEANEILQGAQQIANHVGRVEKCLADIIRRVEDEKDKETAALSTARISRDTFIQIGKAMTRPLPADVDGSWKFGFGELTFAVEQGRLKGSAVIKTEMIALPTVYESLNQPAQSPRVENYRLTGTCQGALCQLYLDHEPTDDSSLIRGIWALSGRPSRKSGFLIFGPDGRTASFTELTGNKLSKGEHGEKTA
jgi:tetratricopeptide (TPR) repeat protein